ncbi:hypothetical protein BC936DRAFT_141334 [Jimgerdemannia flammicorona]|uniref:Uncharacterized protein n=1 Tax=Jimgerdemannia flammicorona TaxID=994334 RepID=A0A433A2D8_9FUNG|nr:hypothetical protein BC936DRAFT_141334 [Jimgerdemannia flammicorona]
MDRRAHTRHVSPTTQSTDPPRTLFDRQHTDHSAGTDSGQSDSPGSSLAGSRSTAESPVLPMHIFGRWKDVTSSTPLNQSLIKSEEDWCSVHNADEEHENHSDVRSYNSDSEITLSVATESSRWESHAEDDDDAPPRILYEEPLDLLDNNEEDYSPRVAQRQKRSSDYGSTYSKAAKIDADPVPLPATSSFLPIPFADDSPVVPQTSFCDFDHIISCIVEEPVVHDEFEYEFQNTEVTSTDDEESSSETDVQFLALLNRHEALKTEMVEMKHVLRGLSRWHLGELDNRLTKFQAAARGYLVRMAPHLRKLRKDSWFSGLRALEADNDKVLQLERRIDQESKSREAMESRFEEAFPQLGVEQRHPPDGKPGRSSKKNNTHPVSNKLAPMKASVNGLSRSRTPLAAASDCLEAKSNAHKVASNQTKVTTAGASPSALFSGRASIREDKHTVFVPAKATTHVRFGKSTAVRKEPSY